MHLQEKDNENASRLEVEVMGDAAWRLMSAWSQVTGVHFAAVAFPHLRQVYMHNVTIIACRLADIF